MYIHFFNIFFSISKNSTVLFFSSLDHANFKDMRHFMPVHPTGFWVSTCLMFISKHSTGEAMVFYDTYPFLSILVQAEKSKRDLLSLISANRNISITTHF